MIIDFSRRIFSGWRLSAHTMGALASKAMRKARRFNAENRAHRVLDREKPIAAPKFESNLRDMEKVLIGMRNDFTISIWSYVLRIIISRKSWFYGHNEQQEFRPESAFEACLCNFPGSQGEQEFCLYST